MARTREATEGVFVKRSTLALSVTVLVIVALAAPVSANPPTYKQHLEKVGFDTLGEPSNGLNTEIVVDFARQFAYVSSANFDPTEDDIFVKAVDVSDPANPVVTDEQATLDGFGTDAGNFGPFDVKIAGNILAASTQGIPTSNPGITLMDISNPADPVPVAHLDQVAIKSPSGSHNSFLWADPVTNKTWLFATGLNNTSLMLFDVTNPGTPIFRAEYNNGAPFVHDNFVQEVGDRVFNYQAGSIGVEILDVTDYVRGVAPSPIPSAHVVGKNHYTSDPADAATVTRPGFAHYIEPTADGDVIWVGDEAGCGQAALVRSQDSSNLPAVGGGAKFLSELGTFTSNPDIVQCSGAIHGGPNNSQLHDFRWTGHNFDVLANDLLVRGNYGKGVDVWDVSDPAAPTLVAKSRGLNAGTGKENKADPGRDKELENPTFIWGAVSDGELIYASDINQGLYVLRLLQN